MDATRRLPETGTAWARPTEIPEACALLVEAGGAGRVVAGCTALSPFALAMDPGVRLAVDLMRVEAAGLIEADGSRMRIGTTASIEQLVEDERVTAQVPILADAVRGIGDEVVRSMATVGGNVTADPRVACELPVVFAALDAELEVVSPADVRTISVAALAESGNGLGPFDVLAAITLPLDSRARWVYRKLTTNVRSYGIASLAINIPTAGPARGYASLGTATPQRLEPVEAALSSGAQFDAVGVAAEACDSLTTHTDALASGAYRVRALRTVLAAELDRLLGEGSEGTG